MDPVNYTIETHNIIISEKHIDFSPTQIHIFISIPLVDPIEEESGYRGTGIKVKKINKTDINALKKLLY